ncbi:MAG: hypothetical protein LBQ68_05585 [Clostridiales bacterium]|jgi:hypothetical protein|nr:hypothetical protein [Clostridiales bacterium]
MSGKEIQVRENKTLVLNNVLLRKIGLKEKEDLSTTLERMNSYIKSKNWDTRGPLIIHDVIKDINLRDETALNMEAMFQLAQTPSSVTLPYIYVPSLRVENCLFARFAGRQSDVHYAHEKMSVYAYENDIALKTETYSVFLETRQEDVVMDIFILIDEENGNESI